MKHKLNKKMNFDDMEVLPIFHNQSQKLLRKEMTSTLYEYYLVGDIGEPDDYIELCDILRSASPNDEVLIRFNSGGGLLSTGDMIINAINESQANVHGFIEHSCGSMATMIFLQCHSWSLSDSAEFFVHNASGGSFGKENENYLSFPMKGYSLALDFKIEKGIFELLNSLDEIVLKYGGRIYLTKDVRVSKETFEKGYPNIEKFRNLRKEYGMDKKFQSLQSKRVGI